jgi:hypothetical protein
MNNASAVVKAAQLIRPSKFAQAILKLKGKALDLDDYKPFEVVYDLSPQILTAMCGRQIGKSVSLASAIISNSIIRSHFGTLFVSPLAQQTSRFSSQYLEPFINSPIVTSHFINSSSKKNVFLRTFNNGSSVTLAYAETEQDADRVRGVSADQMYFDEAQDASLEAIPILEETLSASAYSYRRFTGTAKGEANTLTVLFKRSNMMEWVVKCGSCGKHSIPNDFDNCLKILTTNKEGPGCVHCGALLDMKKGQWLAGKPSIKDHIGVHIPQFCIPARTKPNPISGKDNWGELVSKATRYDTIKLSNEVFGLPVGSGGRPLSLRQVMAVCNSSVREFSIGFPKDSRNILYTVIGVDWSVTGSSKSYTVLTVLGFDFHGKAYLLYAQKLEGIDILDQVERVMQMFNLFECSHIASDRGVGVLQGQLMKRALGDDKVSMINYVAAKTNLRFDREGNYFAADRTLAIDIAVIKVKMGIAKIECPCWDIMEKFWQDALHIYEEESLTGRRLYRKDEDSPDDFLHSLVFALIAQMILNGEFVYQDRGAVVDDRFSF